jgi:hypothetical protein
MDFSGGCNMNNIQRFSKTPKAWEALMQPTQVGRRAHALLLLANGHRSARELSALLGDDVSELALGLHQQGYLQPVDIVSHSDGDSELLTCN